MQQRFLLAIVMILATSSVAQAATLVPSDFVDPNFLIEHQTDVGADSNPDFQIQGTFSRCVKPNTVALTYDDGPGDFTGMLLDVLKELDVKVTFFIVGQMLETPQNGVFLQRAYSEGHLIGAHSYTHRHLNTLSVADQKQELVKTNTAIFNLIKKTPRFFRPPYGEHNTNLDSNVFGINQRMIIWNADPLDWQTLNTTRDIADVERLVGGLKNTGALVLQHDIWETTVNAARTIITDLRAQGFTFVQIDECVGLKPGNRYMEDAVTTSATPTSTSTVSTTHPTTTSVISSSTPASKTSTASAHSTSSSVSPSTSVSSSTASTASTTTMTTASSTSTNIANPYSNNGVATAQVAGGSLGAVLIAATFALLF